MNIGVIGAGAWGTALATVSARGGNNVLLWAYESEIADTINNSHKNRCLPGIELPNAVRATNNMSDMSDMDAWLVVIPAAFFRENMRQFREYWTGQPIIICSKGMESTTATFMSEVLTAEFGDKITGRIAVLSGPQFAAEAASGIPTGSTIAGSIDAISAAHGALSEFYLQESDDIIGAQVCGTGKNVIAILAGFLSEKAGGENEKALKITCAWNEIVTLGTALGAKCETFLGLAGFGDLFLSATSATSRNFSAGVAIARGQDIIGTVEGISAMHGLMKRAKDINVAMPIIREFETIVLKA